VNSDVQHCPASSTADEVSEVLAAAAEVPAVFLNSEVQGSSSSSTADQVSAAQILPGVPLALVNNSTEDCHPGLKEALQILNELIVLGRKSEWRRKEKEN